MASFTPLSKHLWTLLSPKGCPLSVTCRQTAESFTEELALLRWSMCLQWGCFAFSVNKSVHFNNYITQFFAWVFHLWGEQVSSSECCSRSIHSDAYLQKGDSIQQSIDFIFSSCNSLLGQQVPVKLLFEIWSIWRWFSYRGTISHHLERNKKHSEASTTFYIEGLGELLWYHTLQLLVVRFCKILNKTPSTFLISSVYAGLWLTRFSNTENKMYILLLIGFWCSFSHDCMRPKYCNIMRKCLLTFLKLFAPNGLRKCSLLSKRFCLATPITTGLLIFPVYW